MPAARPASRPPPRRATLTRAAVVVRLTDRLRRHGWPRLQMSVMVALTGLAGWLLSALLLHLGLHAMMVRWPLALLGAWGLFLAMLGLWVRLQRETIELPDDVDELLPDEIDLVDALPRVSWPRGGSAGRSGGVAPGGGRFGGAGAQGEAGSLPPGLAVADDASLAGAADGPMPAVGLVDAQAGVGRGSGGGLELPDLGDADEAMVPILIVVLAVGMAAASLYVIWSAPTLLADLLFDGAMSYGLYRRLRADETRDWLSTAVRHTALPFALTAVLLAGAGWGLHKAVPGAWNLSQALHPATIPANRR